MRRARGLDPHPLRERDRSPAQRSPQAAPSSSLASKVRRPCLRLWCYASLAAGGKGLGMGTQPEEALKLAGKLGVLRARDAVARGIPRAVLSRLVASGQLARLGRGTYSLAEADVTQHHSLAEAAARVPSGVVCLLSALRFHDIGTQAPFEVWLAIDKKAWRPRIDSPPTRIVRFSGAALTAGVEEHQIEKVSVRVYSAAKTVADCFRYRNKLGLDVAVEALREFLRAHPRKRAELWAFAKVCRVTTVMHPYLEAFT